MYTAIWLLFALGLLFSLVLWGRGLVKGGSADLFAGGGLFAALCLLSPLAVYGCTPAPLLGIGLIALGFDTAIAGAFGEAARSLTRSARYVLSFGMIAVGMLLLLVL
jgi:hypothetical protein